MIDRDIALRLYEEGETLQAIGNRFGVSRQRIYQIVLPHTSQGAQRRTHKKSHNATPPIKWVLHELQRRGFTAEYLRNSDPFDILVNRTIRIEVRHRTATHRTDGFCGITFLAKNNFDYLVAVIGELGTDNVYIIPSREVNSNLSLSIHPYSEGKHKKNHLQNWSSIK